MAMTDKFTPGPWRYWTQRRPGSEDTCTFRNLTGTEVLRAVTVTITEEDARLIAAAPDLLQALRDMLAHNGPGDKARAIAAIKKATGAA
jgi:hypothetical protein